MEWGEGGVEGVERVERREGKQVEGGGGGSGSVCVRFCSPQVASVRFNSVRSGSVRRSGGRVPISCIAVVVWP